ncbi:MULTISPECIES: LysR family transcriptional regulator [Cupriavidus]|uniref:Regulatory protein, LysR:LysR, substrate-binding protein n=1 Tax=Cupriavidus pinatubonensis (strain JMP 134 / LMG 1197) TaxID=264198 RepID=Q46QI8_CUPPJ|nr:MULTISPECIES: LysR family transcriptional regulator [Cupriavidus]QYY27773.1 LysR family transcriptional regulator [Cupriavidus pinatubonensis]TPQ40171.1 LysR family transcriptional regulator [Cupriavidus pinatubonensis]
MLSLRRLEHFAVLAEERSFSRAARRLNLTQPALTRSIQTLEETLELQLVDRAASGLVLTEAGAMVLERSRRMLGDVRALQREAGRLRGFETGTVNFGVGSFPAAAFLGSVMTRVARDYPGLVVRVETESWRRLLEKLQRDELDFVVAVTHSLPPPADFQVRELPAQRMGFFVRPGHPLAGLGQEAVRGQIAGFGLATTTLPPRARSELAALFGLPSADELPVRLECDNVQVLCEVAGASDAVLFATHEAVRRELAAGTLAPLILEYLAPAPLPLTLVYPGGRNLSGAAQLLVGLLEECAGCPVTPQAPPPAG